MPDLPPSGSVARRFILNGIQRRKMEQLAPIRIPARYQDTALELIVYPPGFDVVGSYMELSQGDVTKAIGLILERHAFVEIEGGGEERCFHNGDAGAIIQDFDLMRAARPLIESIFQLGMPKPEAPAGPKPPVPEVAGAVPTIALPINHAQAPAALELSAQLHEGHCRRCPARVDQDCEHRPAKAVHRCKLCELLVRGPDTYCAMHLPPEGK